MSKNALKIVMAFSIVIQLIAIFLFYITLPNETTFISVVISYVCGVVVFVLSLFSYKKRIEEEGSIPDLKLVIILYSASNFILISIRIIIIIIKS